LEQCHGIFKNTPYITADTKSLLEWDIVMKKQEVESNFISVESKIYLESETDHHMRAEELKILYFEQKRMKKLLHCDPSFEICSCHLITNKPNWTVE
jgi:hypothetical protein